VWVCVVGHDTGHDRRLLKRELISSPFSRALSAGEGARRADEGWRAVARRCQRMLTRKREVFLKAEGYQIVRVRNDNVYEHISDVLDMILKRLEGRL
jgi:Protein of unknown function (DUF559)